MTDSANFETSASVAAGCSSCDIELTTSVVEISSAVFPVTFGGVTYSAEQHADLTAAIAASVCGVGTSTLVEPVA